MCNTERNIKNAAIDILLKEGNFDLSMHEIAEKSEVSRTVINYYFRSKENLLSVVNNEIIRNIVIPKYYELFSADLLRSKIDKYICCSEEVSRSYPYLDLYVISQCKTIITFQEYLKTMQKSYNILLSEIQCAIDAGITGYTTPDCFLIDLFSLTNYSFMYIDFFESETNPLTRGNKTNIFTSRKTKILNVLFMG